MFEVERFGLGFWCLVSGLQIYGLVFVVHGAGFERGKASIPATIVRDLGCRVWGVGYRVQGVGCRSWGVG